MKTEPIEPNLTPIVPPPMTIDDALNAATSMLWCIQNADVDTGSAARMAALSAKLMIAKIKAEAGSTAGQ